MEVASILTSASMLLCVTLMHNAPIPMDLTLVELARLDILELELLDVPLFVLLLAKMEELVLLLILALAHLDLLELNVNLLLELPLDLPDLLETSHLLPLETKTWNQAQLKPSLLSCACF